MTETSAFPSTTHDHARCRSEALAQAEADAAEIPDEAYEIDASEEIARAVESAIGRRLPPAPGDD